MVRPVNLLYFSFLIFLICIWAIRYYGGMSVNYLLNAFLIISFIILLPNAKLIKSSFDKVLLFFLSTSIIVASFVFNTNAYIFLFGLKLLVLYFFIKHYEIKKIEFIKFINNTYLLYVFSSIVFFVFFPELIYDLKQKDNNIIYIFFTDYVMLHSIEGSAASLDTYSAVVLFLNLYVNKSKTMYRKSLIFLTIIVLLWTFRLTPTVSILLALISHKIVKSGKSAFIFILFGIIFFLIILYLILNHSDLYFFGIPLSLIFYQITHARSMIWEQQIIFMLDNYSFFDYLLGDFSSKEFSAQAYQIDGRVKDDLIDNPHNSHLLLFFRSPILYITALLIFLKNIYKKFDVNWFPIIVLIFVGAFTNSQIFGLQNPIYFLIIIYFFSNFKKINE